MANCRDLGPQAHWRRPGIESNQMKSNQIESNRIESNRIESNLTLPNRPSIKIGHYVDVVEEFISTMSS